MTLLTTKEVAIILGISLRRVQALVASGRFHGAKRFSRDWLIPEKAIRTWQPQPQGWPKGKARRKAKEHT